MEATLTINNLVLRLGGARATAATVGVYRGTVYRWLDGSRSPSLAHRLKMLDAVNATDAERLEVLTHDHTLAVGQKTPKARPLVPSIRRISRAALASTEARVQAQTAPRGEG